MVLVFDYCLFFGIWEFRLVNAATGTGKTLVYLATVVHHLLLQNDKQRINRSDGTYGMLWFFIEECVDYGYNWYIVITWKLLDKISKVHFVASNCLISICDCVWLLEGSVVEVTICVRLILRLEAYFDMGMIVVMVFFFLIYCWFINGVWTWDC